MLENLNILNFISISKYLSENNIFKFPNKHKKQDHTNDKRDYKESEENQSDE